MNAARIIQESSYDLVEVEALVEPVRPERINVWPASRWLQLLWRPGITGVTQGKRIFVRPDVLLGDRDRLARLVIHELVHVRQFVTRGYVPFMIRYVFDHVRGRLSGMSGREAYLAIPAEVEAREWTARVT